MAFSTRYAGACFTMSRCFFAAALAVCLSLGSQVSAQSIDLRLNLTYDTPANPLAGGTWEVVGISSNEGIQGISFSVSGVSTGALQTPVGRVNGLPVDNAGFDFVDVTTSPGNTFNFFAFQGIDSMGAGSGPEADAFYRFGTRSDYSPSAADHPSYSTLVTSPQNIPWSVGDDPFGDANWDDAALLASGAFSGETTPSIVDDDNLFGSVWTVVGTSNMAGTFVDSGVTITLAETVSNLDDLLADYNDDGLIDAIDYAVWRETLGDTVTPGTGADGSGNGVIDTADFTLWLDNYGAVGAPAATTTASPVPSPGGGVLISLFVTGIGLLRRGKQQQSCPQGIFHKNQEYREKLLDTNGLPSHNAAS